MRAVTFAAKLEHQRSVPAAAVGVFTAGGWLSSEQLPRQVVLPVRTPWLQHSGQYPAHANSEPERATGNSAVASGTLGFSPCTPSALLTPQAQKHKLLKHPGPELLED